MDVFYVDNDILVYQVMPFELVNVGVTYQRIVNKFFKNSLGRNMKAYVDYILAKSKLRCIYTNFEKFIA